MASDELGTAAIDQDAQSSSSRPRPKPVHVSGPDGSFELTHHSPCFQRSIELLGRRWTGAILLAMHGGLDRFTSIRDVIPGLSDRLLTERLRELESEGIVVREPSDGYAIYRLTPKGEALRPMITAIAEWTSRFGVESNE